MGGNEEAGRLARISSSLRDFVTRLLGTGCDRKLSERAMKVDPEKKWARDSGDETVSHEESGGLCIQQFSLLRLTTLSSQFIQPSCSELPPQFLNL